MTDVVQSCVEITDAAIDPRIVAAGLWLCTTGNGLFESRIDRHAEGV